MSIPAKYLHAAGCLLAQVAGEELSRQELDEVAWAGYRRGDGAKVAEALRGACVPDAQHAQPNAKPAPSCPKSPLQVPL